MPVKREHDRSEDDERKVRSRTCIACQIGCMIADNHKLPGACRGPPPLLSCQACTKNIDASEYTVEMHTGPGGCYENGHLPECLACNKFSSDQEEHALPFGCLSPPPKPDTCFGCIERSPHLESHQHPMGCREIKSAPDTASTGPSYTTWPTNRMVQAGYTKPIAYMASIYDRVAADDSPACVLLGTGCHAFKDKEQRTFTLYSSAFQGGTQDVAMVHCIDDYMTRKGVLPVFVSFSRDFKKGKEGDTNDPKNYIYRAAFRDVGETAAQVFRPYVDRLAML